MQTSQNVWSAIVLYIILFSQNLMKKVFKMHNVLVPKALSTRYIFINKSKFKQLNYVLSLEEKSSYKRKDLRTILYSSVYLNKFECNICIVLWLNQVNVRRT